MDEKQLLAAIGQMMDEKIGTLRDEMVGHMDKLDSRMDGMESRMDNKFDALRDELHTEISGLETRIDDKIDKLGERMTLLEVSYENNTQKILNLLQEDYSRVAAAVVKTGDYDNMKATVKDHQNALENHNQRISKLEKKVV